MDVGLDVTVGTRAAPTVDESGGGGPCHEEADHGRSRGRRGSVVLSHHGSPSRRDVSRGARPLFAQKGSESMPERMCVKRRVSGSPSVADYGRRSAKTVRKNGQRVPAHYGADSAAMTSPAARTPDRIAPSMPPCVIVAVSVPAQCSRSTGARNAGPKAVSTPGPRHENTTI